MHLTYFLCKICVVECSRRSVKLDNILIDIIGSNSINFSEIMSRYEAIDVKKPKTTRLNSNFQCILLISYEKLVSYDIHIEVLI
jgi:hypothetical protein